MNPEHVIERDGKKFVKYGGLLDEAHNQGLKAIVTALIQVPDASNGDVAIVQATVTTEKGTFSGIGDASPRNVSGFLAEHIIRMAETRAKARALRDAVNVDMTSLEELGEHEGEIVAPPASEKQVAFIVDLAEKAGLNEERFIARFGKAPDAMNKDEASRAIESLRTPEAKAATEPTPIRPAAAQAAPAADRASVAQVRAIYSINRKIGWSEPEIDDMCLSIYGCSPSELSKRQASEWISKLQEDAK